MLDKNYFNKIILKSKLFYIHVVLKRTNSAPNSNILILNTGNPIPGP